MLLVLLLVLLLLLLLLRPQFVEITILDITQGGYTMDIQLKAAIIMAITFEKSQRGYLRPGGSYCFCGQILYHLQG